MIDDKEKEQMKEEYIKGNSVQAIARTHRVSVEDVLGLIGMTDMTTVSIPGDMIDEDEAGTAPISSGSIQRVKYDLS